MTTDRVIVCLDVRGGRVVKGVQFENLRDMGDPAEMAARYEQDGADEVVFLDVTASHEERGLFLDAVTRTAERLFIPLAVGGGIVTLDDANRALRAGADKVSLNSAIVKRPQLLGEIAAAIGSQCVIASIDAGNEGGRTVAFTHGGRRATQLEVVEWAHACAAHGAGEILLTAIARDGTRAGYDVALTRKVADAVSVPVIASGGAGSAQHLLDGFERGGAAAVLVAGIVHDGTTSVKALKGALAAAGRNVRT